MALTQMLVMPMFFISGALFPVANLPTWLARPQPGRPADLRGRPDPPRGLRPPRHQRGRPPGARPGRHVVRLARADARRGGRGRAARTRHAGDRGVGVQPRRVRRAPAAPEHDNREEREMDIGIGLPNAVRGVERDGIVDWARRAEAAGFSALGHARPDRLSELRVADRARRRGGRHRAHPAHDRHPHRPAAGQHGAVRQADGDDRPPLGRPRRPRPGAGRPRGRLRR